MDLKNIPRRNMLKIASAVSGATAYASVSAPAVKPQNAQTSADVIISATPYTAILDYPITPKRYSEVKVKDRFWHGKIATNAEITIPFEVAKLTQAASGRGFGGGVLEASILSLATNPNPQLQTQVDARVQALRQNPSKGNSGFEIAATYYSVTGKRDLLDNAVKSANALYQDFKVNKPPFSGGERDAINCVQLYRVTHDKKHLDLAKHYLDIRGLEDSVNGSRHNQSYKPVLEQSEAVGHAVNCVSLMVSLVDVGTLTGIKAYFDAGHRMWQDAVSRKMYITGGVGSSGNEGFGEPYWLPNISAYSETCAVLMFMTLNHRLFLATGDSKFIDVMERGMYNNALDGVSASGNRFFYVNRLASAGDGRDNRWERASLECCPPNMVRFLASMPGFIYAQDRRDAIYVNLYVSSEADFQVNGKQISLSVESDMPWGGKSTINIRANGDVQGSIRLRLPGWAKNQPAPSDLYSYADKPQGQTRLTVNGNSTGVSVDPSGYIRLDRNWNGGDVIEIEFPFEARKVVTNAKVKENRRRVAVERGPIVYCSEWPDLPGGRVLQSLYDGKAELKPSFDQGFLGGATVINISLKNAAAPTSQNQSAKLIPYHLWANRGQGEMTVWLPVEAYSPGDIGPAGGFIFYVNPNYASDGWRYLEAAPFDQSAGAKWGCFRRSIAGAKGTAIGTGRQNTLDMLAACSDTDTAAALCANYALNGVKGWFLPSRDELAQMYRNLKATGVCDFQIGSITDNFCYWASSQQTADMAVHIDFADNGRLHGDDKDFPRRVRAIRAF